MKLKTIYSTFSRFSQDNRIRVKDLKIFNTQWKVCTLLMNLRIAVKLFNYTVKPHQKNWMIKNYDFQEKEDPKPTERVKEAVENHTEMIKAQEMFLKELLIKQKLDVVESEDSEENKSGIDEEERKEKEKERKEKERKK